MPKLTKKELMVSYQAKRLASSKAMDDGLFFEKVEQLKDMLRFAQASDCATGGKAANLFAEIQKVADAAMKVWD